MYDIYILSGYIMVVFLMIKIWGKVITNNKIIKDLVVTSDTDESYQQNLKRCITQICEELDITKPYWLPNNLEEYNTRGKVIFTKDNFIDEINFDTRNLIKR
jgi:subtilase family serine protease